jgi:hypothetical protein
VKAANNAGESAYTSVVSATTQAPALTAPAAPTNLQATVASSSEIDLTWTDNANNEIGFKVYRNGILVGTITTANTVSFNDTGLAANTTYLYYVAAYNAAGNSANSGTVSAKTNVAPTVAPAAPQGLAGTAVSDSKIHLSWTDNANNETGFKVYRDGILIKTIAVADTQAYDDTVGLLPNTTYSYIVTAYNAVGDSANSNTVSVKTPLTVPLPPSGLSATGKTAATIELNWLDNSGNEEGFYIYRWSGSAWVNIKTVAANVTSTLDGSLPANTTFRYKVSSVRHPCSAGHVRCLRGNPNGVPDLEQPEHGRITYRGRVLARGLSPRDADLAGVGPRHGSLWGRVLPASRGRSEHLVFVSDPSLSTGKRRVLGIQSGRSRCSFLRRGVAIVPS